MMTTSREIPLVSTVSNLRCGRILVVCLFVLLSACASRGGKALQEDSYYLTNAISKSLTEEALLNIVRLRYDDWPVFVEVKEVFLSRTWETRVVVGVEVKEPLPDDGNDIYKPGVQGKYSYSPKVLYQPLSGKKYTRAIITPAPPASVLALIASGYPANLVLRNFVQAVNGFENTHVTENTGYWASEEFVEFSRVMRAAQLQNALELRRKKGEHDEKIILVINRELLDQGTLASWDMLRPRLGLGENFRGYFVEFGGVNFDPGVITLRTRSIMQFAKSLAIHVEVPPAHLAQGKAKKTNWLPSALGNAEYIGEFGVMSGDDAPDDAYASVPYLGQWFWIDDTDTRSKANLQNLLFLANITESGRSSDTQFVIPVN
jgi:hypothetical protein